jgi:DNA-binding XRE family transcriptional regulator
MKNIMNTYIKETTTTFQINDMTISVSGKRRFDSMTNEPVFDYDLDNALLIEAGKKYRESIHFEGEKLIEFRKKHDLTQALFAKILGISRKTLISYEKNYAIPNNQNLKLIQSMIKDESLLEKMSTNFNTPLTYKEMEAIGNIRVEESMDEYSGFQAINEDILISLILFFSDKGISQTRLQKALFYSDFLSFKAVGISLTGLYYRKFPFGPYSEAINKVSDDLIRYKKMTRKLDHLMVSQVKSNLDFLNEIQLKIIEKVKNYIQKNDAKVVSEESHLHNGWIQTPDFGKISYEYALEMEDNFFQNE